jgi:S1-C subfamily serine protease
LVQGVNKESAAEVAGLLVNDVIIGIDGHSINSVSELQEWVARTRPGKEISISYLREESPGEVRARWRNNDGNEEVVKRQVKHELGGIEMEDVPYKELTALQLEGGVRVRDVSRGKWKEAGIRKGFVIGYIDKIPVDNVEDLNRILDFKKGESFWKDSILNGQKGTYGVDW